MFVASGQRSAVSFQRLDLRRLGRIRSREYRQRLCIHGVESARRVAEGPPQNTRHRAAEQCSAEAASAARPVAVRRVPVARDEAGTDGDVAGIRAHEFE